MSQKEKLRAEDIKIESVTKGPYHHFFGFHDLLQTNAKGDLLLSLETSLINRPPYPNEKISSGIVDIKEKKFYKVHDTCAFNYPQGARQQWIGESDLFVCNDMVGQNWGSHISDARSRKSVETLEFPVHCLDSVTGDAFYPDYKRLYLVGGYGYVGLPDKYANEDIPTQAGISKANIKTKKSELLVSVAQVAACGVMRPVKTGYPHYLTHLVLNPAKTRLAFLHRYRVSDGGETTRLMSIGVDGNNLRCLAKGFLSHFDWVDDDNIFIWGVHQGYGLSIREKPLLRLPVVGFAAQMAKMVYRRVKNVKGVQAVMKQDQAFLMITDDDQPSINKVALGVIPVDGHPMVCPADRNWMVNDTYPNKEGLRILMLYKISDNSRVDLGQFEMSREIPDEKNIDSNLIRSGFDRRIQKKYSLKKCLFARSGLHCDLHPRWSYDGKSVLFDSIHEGTRQIYMADVSGITGVKS